MPGMKHLSAIAISSSSPTCAATSEYRGGREAAPEAWPVSPSMFLRAYGLISSFLLNEQNFH